MLGLAFVHPASIVLILLPFSASFVARLFLACSGAILGLALCPLKHLVRPDLPLRVDIAVRWPRWERWTVRSRLARGYSEWPQLNIRFNVLNFRVKPFSCDLCVQWFWSLH